MNDRLGESFSARDVFDPSSYYNRMRACFREELKMRGLFYELKAAREASRGRRLANTAAEPAELVLLAGDPVREIAATIREVIIRAGPRKRQLQLGIRIEDPAHRPAPEAHCRVFLLTGGIIERICGPEALRSVNWIRGSLLHLFEGKSTADRREIARILSAVPELTRTVDADGVCDLTFDLPPHASDFDSLPEVEAIVAVIEPAPGK